MDGERRRGGVAGVEDEFTCAGVLRGSLTSMHATVERIFSVTFRIGTDDDLPHSSNGQIWLKLGGRSHDVQAAKLFVKGVVNQEEQQEVSYPKVLHCVFCGAKGLFMDSLIRSTSAQILIGSPGCLLISGLAEPVVRAYSLITDLLERYKSTQARRPEPEASPGESLESRRNFKALVEQFEDRHILDLLVLPGSVKEVLLDLVSEGGLISNPGAEGTAEVRQAGLSEDRWGAPAAATATHTLPDVDELATPPLDTRGGVEGPEQTGASGATALAGPEASTGNKEFSLLLKFFTAMGYTEDVVKRVLARTGLKEASKILDLVQQEQDNSDREHMARRPCETEHREEGEVAGDGAGGGAEESIVWLEKREEEEERGEGEEEDFVLGVLTKAAVSCGYKEQEVAKVYSMLPERSTHHLLLELQREADAPREEPRETDDLVTVSGGSGESGGSGGPEAGWLPPARRLPHHPDDQPKRTKRLPASKPQLAEQATPAEVKGPPMATYPPYTPVNVPNSEQKRPAQVDHAPSLMHQQHALTTPSSVVVVTGEQRFLEGLQMPFDLQLTDKPGDPKLRTIIIDGSNVAMRHGLGHFFSCRGIALAVQHFWDRGHRNISTFLPQWRKKNDPRIKEQHYLDKLEKLGLLSYTPSREVQGKRISSYDDRFMLQYAQKTGGVIVTNDNLRDLLEESTVWVDIIQKSLLQYTFVGDHFMVPDDPLGRGGPHLDDFLRSQHGTPSPGSPFPGGMASSLPTSRVPRSHTGSLNFRNWTSIGAADATVRGRGRGHARGHGRSRDPGHARRQQGGGGAEPPERTAEQTQSLREQLCQVFSGQDAMVTLVLQCHPAETDVNALSYLLLEQQAD